MNRHQARMVQTIKDKIPAYHEIKRFDIEHIGRRVLVVIETGMPGDEDTMAEVLAREFHIYVIGPRGGIKEA